MAVRQFRRGLGRRLINAFITATVRLGVGASHRYLLTVAGRKSGRPYTTPVSVVSEGPNRFLVGPYGETGWVKNARAAPLLTLTRGGREHRFTIMQVPPAVAAPILRLYLKLEPITRPYFNVGADAPESEFLAEAASHPVFRLQLVDPDRADC